MISESITFLMIRICIQQIPQVRNVPIMHSHHFSSVQQFIHINPFMVPMQINGLHTDLLTFLHKSKILPHTHLWFPHKSMAHTQTHASSYTHQWLKQTHLQFLRKSILHTKTHYGSHASQQFSHRPISASYMGH